MHFVSASLALLAAVGVTAAHPSVFEARQGGSFVSVGLKYNATGCTDQHLIFADPIFGDGNMCQPLDRTGTGQPIRSYKTVGVRAGCTVKIYENLDCQGDGYSAPVNGCVSGNAPFRSVFVTCPRG